MTELNEKTPLPIHGVNYCYFERWQINEVRIKIYDTDNK